MTLRLILVDDQEMYRLGFRMLLETQEGVEVVGEAEDGRAAVDLIERVEADIVLMDVRMPRMNGIEATRTIGQGGAGGPRVIVLTTFDLDEYAFAGLRAGASGFLLKDTRPTELAEAIRTVASGEAVVSPRVTQRMLEMFAPSLPNSGAPTQASDPRIDSLTPREKEILVLMSQGLSNAEIADHLVVSATTVKTHVGNVLAKLDVRDRVQAVVVAYETGLMA